MPCAINKQDSNITGLAFAEEVCLKQLPVEGVDGFDPTWYSMEPNSYSDFGGEISTVTRAPIDPSRQNKKGTVTGLDASGGFNNDLVNDPALRRLLQGFFFADIREKPSTQPMNAAKINVTGVTASSDKFATSATAVAFNRVGLLVQATGFGTANDALHVVVSADTDDVTVGNGTVDQASPPAAAKLEVVGYEFGADDAAIVKTGNVIKLTSTNNELASLGLIVGEWIFIGGDTLAANRFVNNVGFARIGAIAAGQLTFDDVAFLDGAAGASEAGTGKTIRIFYGSVIKNEKLSNLIKRRSYNIERTLGLGATATQAEYLEGAVANELTLNIPSEDKLNLDMGFVALDNTHRSGEVDDEVKDGTRIPAAGSDAYNTSSDVFRIKMNVVDPTSSNPEALFGYVTEGNINIQNGVEPNTAVGVLGAFDTSAGNFVVGGSVEAYFQTIEAVRAVRNNADVNLSVIFAKDNSGFLFDIPLLGLGGGRLNVEKDRPIMVSLEPAGAENASGYTLLYNWFSYLPNVAMPQ